MIQPTVGRVVHFWHQGAQAGDKPLAAIIADVISERVINVGVLNQHGGMFDRQHVQLLQEDDQPPHADYCAWMEYQKGQAAKVDDGLAALAARVAALEHRTGTEPPAHEPPKPELDNAAQI